MRTPCVPSVDGRSVGSILCETVDEGSLTSEDQSARRWGMRFSKLTAAQTRALDEFIDSQLRRS